MCIVTVLMYSYVTTPEKMTMPHFTISLPEDVTEKLEQEADSTGIKKSTLIAQHIQQHYENPAEAYEDELRHRETTIKERQATIEKHVASLKELQTKLDTTGKSTEVVIKGLQNEIELLKQRIQSLEDAKHVDRVIISDLRADKDNLLKQLTLVTLRLPEPKQGFWARVFRKKDKNRRSLNWVEKTENILS